MKKMLVWETLGTISGGQKMTLTVMEMLKDEYEFYCLIPCKGTLSEELDRRQIPYVLMGDQSLPTGIKGKSVIFRYGWMSFKTIIKSLRIIHKEQPDVLYAPGPAALPWSAVCGRLAHRPVVWHLHHIFLDGATKKLLNICGGWKSVKKIIAVSNCVGEQITNQAAKEKIQVIYNPVDVKKYSSGDAEKVRPELEKIIGKNIHRGGVILILQIAAITKAKQQEKLINAISALKRRNIPAIGLFAGGVITDADRSYQKSLEDTIAAEHLEDNVFFLGFRNDIPDLLKLVDMVLIPSEEGLSLVAMEAMSAGCGVLACAQGGAKELLERAEYGNLYGQDAPAEEIAEAIVHTIDEKNNATLQKGQAFCEEQTPEAYKRHLLEVF